MSAMVGAGAETQALGGPLRIDLVGLGVTGFPMAIAVARGLVAHRDVLFADEPTGSFDSRNGELVMGLLTRAARDQGSTVRAKLARLLFDSTYLVDTERAGVGAEGAVAGDNDIAIAAITVAELRVGVVTRCGPKALPRTPSQRFRSSTMTSMSPRLTRGCSLRCDAKGDHGEHMA